VFDRWLETNADGRRFLDSLPAAPIALDHDLEDIGRLSAPRAPGRRSALVRIESRCKLRHDEFSAYVS
jgi:hypothetical protein